MKNPNPRGVFIKRDRQMLTLLTSLMTPIVLTLAGDNFFAGSLAGRCFK